MSRTGNLIAALDGGCLVYLRMHPNDEPESGGCQDEQGPQIFAVTMADVLSHTGMHPTTRRLLLDSVSARTGVGPDEIVPDGFNPWAGGPYALNATGGTTYIAREGMYWRRGSREKDFTPVTNFRVRLLEDHVDAMGKVTHQARLEISGSSIQASFSSAVFDSSKRLLTALTGAAAGVGVECPVVGDLKAKRLLPELIKATQSCLALAERGVTGR